MKKDNILVGLELEFSNDTTRKWSAPVINSSKELKDIIAPWKEKLIREASESKGAMTVFEPKEKNNCLLRITYNNKTTESALTWDITTDISVIEVIIQKAPFSYYLEFKKNIQTHIYKYANDIGLQVVTSGDYIHMTHINIDFDTGFDKNFKSVLKYLIKQEKAYSPNTETEVALRLNAHYLKEVLPIKEYNTKMQKGADLLEKATVKYDEIKDFMTINNKDIKRFLDDCNVNKDTKEKITIRPLHFQFINIEHLSEVTNEEEKRIEDRRHASKDSFEGTCIDVDEVLMGIVECAEEVA